MLSVGVVYIRWYSSSWMWLEHPQTVVKAHWSGEGVLTTQKRRICLKGIYQIIKTQMIRYYGNYPRGGGCPRRDSPDINLRKCA